jgi:long-chain acyl-CoA synthetase
MMEWEGVASHEQAGTRASEAVLPRPRHPWERHYPADLDWNLEIEPLTVPALLARSVAAFGEKPAVEYKGTVISFAALGRAVDGVAAGLIALGARAGMTVGLYLPNTPWHTVCLFAALKTGARVAHLSPLDAQRELIFKLRDSGAELLISTDLFDLATKAVELLEASGVRTLLVGADAFWGGEPTQWASSGMPAAGQTVSLADLLDTPAPSQWPEVRTGDIAMLQYTGGTTGLPKGAILTHGNVTAATAIYLSWRDAGIPAPGDGRVIGVLPMFHIYAQIVVLMLGIAQGDLILLRPRFDVAAALRDIKELGATSFPAVPTMLIALLNAEGVGRQDFASLMWVGSGGAPLPHEVGQRIEELVGTRLRGGWGMTETCSAGTRLPMHAGPRAAMIGVPLPRIEMRVVSLEDPAVVLPPGSVGELAIRGPNIFRGYWNQEALSAQAFIDGFFLTGDIGRMEADGLFFLVDRKKRMIISGGFNVYPTMIENSIYEHPDVEEVIVIGVPDPYRGEAAKAFIKLRDGAPPLTLDALRAFLADKIGRHEMPTALELRGSLPKSPVGKLLATELVEEERRRAQNM